MIPATVRVFVDVAASPLAAVRVIPRFASNEAAPAACRTPPLRVTELAVVDPGTAPKLGSVEIDKIPAATVVTPSYVFVPPRATVPVWLAPLIVMPKLPVMMPATVRVLVDVAANPLAAVKVMPRFASNDAAPVA